MDITFFDFQGNTLFILPSSSKGIGYTSMNTTEEFNGDGKFELVFYCPELVNIAKAHPEGMLLLWKDFNGIVTDWQFNKEYRLFGMSLNGAAHKIVVPKISAITYDCNVIFMNLLNTYFLDIIAEIKGVLPTQQITFETSEYNYGNDIIQNALSLVGNGCGYKIYIIPKSTKLGIEILTSITNPIMFSEGNLNIYDVEENFNNKKMAHGGYYQTKALEGQEEGVWEYVAIEAVTGLHKQDVILKAKTRNEAIAELKTYNAEHTLDVKTKNVKYGVDYKLGDIVRVMQDGVTVRKKVTAISRWYEKTTYNEEPKLSDIEE